MERGQICLRKGEERDILAGSVWIFENEIDWIDDICKDGSIVDILDSRMHFLARGYCNRHSKITVRILTRDPAEEIDAAFFRRRIEAAWNFRQKLGFSNADRKSTRLNSSH